MLLAVMDLGSNSFKMTVAQYLGSDRKVPFKIIHKERHPVQLGASVFSGSHRISESHRIAALKALSQMKNNIQRFNYPLVRVVGTSALRDAVNGPAFVRETERKLGIHIDVISGVQEASIISQGLEWEYPFVDRGVLVDIGGGSTEVSQFGKGWSEASHNNHKSFQVGSVRVAKVWEKGLKKKDIEKVLRAQIGKLLKSAKPPRNYEYLVGSAGAIQSLGEILSTKKKNMYIHLDDLDEWIDENLRQSQSILEKKFGLSSSRARVVVPGAVILSEVLRWLREDEIFVTQMTLRNGLLVNTVERLRRENWIL